MYYEKSCYKAVFFNWGIMPYIFESLWLIPSRSCFCSKNFNSQGIFQYSGSQAFSPHHIISTVFPAHSSFSLCLVLCAAVHLRVCVSSVGSHRSAGPERLPSRGQLPGLLCLLPCLCPVAALCSQLNCVSGNWRVDFSLKQLLELFKQCTQYWDTL